MLDDNLVWLINWYSRQCDGDWEHSFGINIYNGGNAGWSITVSVQETELKDKKFQEIIIDRTENDWTYCKVKNGFFEGVCSLFNLEETLGLFRNWADS